MYRKTLSTLVILFVAFSVAAQSGDSRTRDRFESAGYTVVRTRTQGGMPVWDLQTDDGERFAVHMIGALTEQRLAAIDSLSEIVFAIDGLDIERMRIVFDENRGTAIVIPRRFSIDGTRYEEYMPSGMQFIYDEAPSFDFRMLVDNLAVRINGAYLTEEQFLARIERAVENPAAYIQSSDPQFLAQQIRELQRIVDVLEVETAALREEGEASSARLESMIQREVARLEREGRQIIADGEAAIAETNARIDDLSAELTEKIDGVSSDTMSLAEEFTKLRRGSIVLASRNLFGSLKELPPETIARVVELRAADPDLSADEARTQVNGYLGEGEQQLHGKHVQAIYALFFNDYE